MSLILSFRLVAGLWQVVCSPRGLEPCSLRNVFARPVHIRQCVAFSLHADEKEVRHGLFLAPTAQARGRGLLSIRYPDSVRPLFSCGRRGQQKIAICPPPSGSKAARVAEYWPSHGGDTAVPSGPAMQAVDLQLKSLHPEVTSVSQVQSAYLTWQWRPSSIMRSPPRGESSGETIQGP